MVNIISICFSFPENERALDPEEKPHQFTERNSSKPLIFLRMKVSLLWMGLHGFQMSTIILCFAFIFILKVSWTCHNVFDYVILTFPFLECWQTKRIHPSLSWDDKVSIKRVWKQRSWSRIPAPFPQESLIPHSFLSLSWIPFFFFSRKIHF